MYAAVVLALPDNPSSIKTYYQAAKAALRSRHTKAGLWPLNLLCPHIPEASPALVASINDLIAEFHQQHPETM